MRKSIAMLEYNICHVEQIKITIIATVVYIYVSLSTKFRKLQTKFLKIQEQ